MRPSPITPTDLTGRNTANAWLVSSYQFLPLGLLDGIAQFFDEDGVGPAQQVGEFPFYFAQDAHPEAGAGEWMAVHHRMRQAERDAELAHFVLEQFAQRLQQFQVQGFGQAADVVVALDGVALLALAGAFDHVRIDRALRQPFGVLELAGFGLEHFDEFAADDLALVLPGR